MFRGKTAELFAAACEVGPVLGDTTPPHVYEPLTWGPADAMAGFGPPNGWVDPVKGV